MKIVFTKADALEAIAKLRKTGLDTLTLVDGKPEDDFATANVEITKKKATRKAKTAAPAATGDAPAAEGKKKRGATSWTPGDGSK